MTSNWLHVYIHTEARRMKWDIKDFILLQYDSSCTKKGATYHNYWSLQTIYNILPNVMEKSKHIKWLLNLLNGKYKVKFQFYSSKNWLFFILVIFVEILLNWIFFFYECLTKLNYWCMQQFSRLPYGGRFDFKPVVWL